MDDDNDILIGDDIVRSITFDAVISGTTDVLVNVENLFGKRALNKINFKIRTGSMETHELCWRKDIVKVIKSSNVSVPVIISLTKIQRYENNYLFVNVVSRIKSVMLALQLKEGGDAEPLLSPINDISTKDVSYLAALHHIVITKNNTELIT